MNLLSLYQKPFWGFHSPGPPSALGVVVDAAHLLEVGRSLVDDPKLSKLWHRHVQGVYPGAVVHSRTLYHRLYLLIDVLDIAGWMLNIQIILHDVI